MPHVEFWLRQHQFARCLQARVGQLVARILTLYRLPGQHDIPQIVILDGDTFTSEIHIRELIHFYKETFQQLLRLLSCESPSLYIVLVERVHPLVKPADTAIAS